jgi:hypothetical protein
VLAALLLGLGSAAGDQKVAELIEARRAELAYWHQLGASGVVGLERFALTVQRVVDLRASQSEHGREAARRLILDDLVDLFVSDHYQVEKSMVMTTPSVLGNDAVSEEEAGLEGFGALFRAGEGRFRHFALNAAASRSAPDALVELAARVRGGDLRGGSPDTVADIATNRIGREFGRLLLERPLAELANDAFVHDWIKLRFGER